LLIIYYIIILSPFSLLRYYYYAAWLAIITLLLRWLLHYSILLIIIILPLFFIDYDFSMLIIAIAIFFIMPLSLCHAVIITISFSRHYAAIMLPLLYATLPLYYYWYMPLLHYYYIIYASYTIFLHYYIIFAISLLILAIIGLLLIAYYINIYIILLRQLIYWCHCHWYSHCRCYANITMLARCRIGYDCTYYAIDSWLLPLRHYWLAISMPLIHIFHYIRFIIIIGISSLFLHYYFIFIIIIDIIIIIIIYAIFITFAIAISWYWCRLSCIVALHTLLIIFNIASQAIFAFWLHTPISIWLLSFIYYYAIIISISCQPLITPLYAAD